MFSRWCPLNEELAGLLMGALSRFSYWHDPASTALQPPGPFASMTARSMFLYDRWNYEFNDEAEILPVIKTHQGKYTRI